MSYSLHVYKPATRFVDSQLKRMGYCNSKAQCRILDISVSKRAVSSFSSTSLASCNLSRAG